MVSQRTVDLFTTRRDLEGKILSQYEGVLKEEQHHVDKSEPEEHLYCFYKLPCLPLIAFLQENNFTPDDYELRDSETGDFVTEAPAI